MFGYNGRHSGAMPAGRQEGGNPGSFIFQDKWIPDYCFGNDK
jgi:hypothetical protein